MKHLAVQLSGEYGWRGKLYGPDHTSIPQDLAIALNIPGADEQIAETATSPEPKQLDGEDSAPSLEHRKATRQAELEEAYRDPNKGFRHIKALSERYGLGDRAPAGGWDNAISALVEHEAENGLL